MGGRVECDEGDTPDVDVGVLQGVEELAQAFFEEAVDGLGLVGDGELDGGDDGASREWRGTVEVLLELWHESVGIEEGQFAEAFGNNISGACHIRIENL